MPPRSMEWIRPLRSAFSDSRVACLLIAAFALCSLIGLDRVPLVSLDEPWIAEPGLRFWQTGVFTSELHRGFSGVERHFLLHAPLFSIIVGGVMAILGPGLFQARLVSLSMATGTAALTYALGRRLLSPRHGLLAVVMLTAWRVSPGVRAYPSGIPLVDLGRLVRYDIAVPVFGVGAFLLVVPLLTPTGSDPAPVSRARLVLAGVCVALAVSCHPAGLAWAAILCAALVLTRGWAGGLMSSGWIAAGTIAGLLPYAWWVFRGWNDFLLQQRLIADRYDVFNPRFYAENILLEWRRYGQIGRGLLNAQPGAWLLAICGLTGVWTLWRDPDARIPGGRVLRLALLVGAGLFALGLKPKPYYYVATLWPLLALTASVGLVALLRTPTRIVRIAAIVMMLAAFADGLRAWDGVTLRATSVTSYAALCDRLAARIPPDSRVLALPHYWFGLAPRVRAYRSFFGPLLFASPRFAAQYPPLGDMLDATDANVIVLDRPMLMFLDEALDPAKSTDEYLAPAKALRAYLAQRSERRVVLDDPSYGRFEIHFLRPQRAVAALPRAALP